MDKVVLYAAYLFCVIQIFAAFFILTHAYGRDQFFALLLVLPPVFALWALCAGPDIEERRLARSVRKAKLKSELDALSKGGSVF